MNNLQVLLATVTWAVIIFFFYRNIGFAKIKNCYLKWFTKTYWTDYNIVEALSWITKAIIIVPGLIFGINVWQLYFFTLITSMALIWASNKKLLPTLVAFNTLWVWLSLMVLVQHLPFFDK